MYIRNIISHLRGFTILNSQYGEVLAELEQALSKLPLSRSGAYHLSYAGRPVCKY